MASDCGRVPIADAKQEVVGESLFVDVDRVLDKIVRVAAALTSAGRRRPPTPPNINTFRLAKS